MTDFSSFFPIFSRTEEVIRDEFDVRANAGLTADDPGWVDTRQGSMYWLATQPMVIEFAMAYDRMNEAAAAGILSTSWGDKLDLHAASYGESRTAASPAVGQVTFTGTDGTLIGTGVRVSPVQTDPDVEPPIFETITSGTIAGGTLTLEVQAIVPGEAGNVSAGTVTFMQTGVAGVTTVTNALAFSGGEEVESDQELKDRLLLLFSGKGSGTVADYAREVLKWPGVGRVYVEPAFAGAGTVRVQVLSETGDPVGGTIVADLQAYLDPTPGLGGGWAPINHEVTVATPTAQPIHVDATISFEDGYSLTGTSGTVALATLIDQAIRDYLDSLQIGEDVIFNHVRARIFRVEGVYDVTALTVDTVDPPLGTTNVAIGATVVAQAGDIDLA